jgi:DNA-binding NarL/FixJ family response regulator
MVGMSDLGIKIIIADTQYLVTEALKSLLENDERFLSLQIVGSQFELLKSLEKDSCQLLITDFALFDYDSVDDLLMIRQKFPATALLILTNSISKTEFSEFSKIGIKNILYKTADREEIFTAIDATLRGKKFYSEEILDLIMESGENKPVLEEIVQLTVSEIEIVRLIAAGKTTKEIAKDKCISFHTVNTHRHRPATFILSLQENQ